MGETAETTKKPRRLWLIGTSGGAFLFLGQQSWSIIIPEYKEAA